LDKAFGGFLFLLIALVAGAFLMHRFLPETTCGLLHPDAMAAMKDSITRVEDYRRSHGRLPPEPTTIAEVFQWSGYRPMADGSYEMDYLSFDGPSITYRENGDRWQCDL
jgi:hypothetical protein